MMHERMVHPNIETEDTPAPALPPTTNDSTSKTQDKWTMIHPNIDTPAPAIIPPNTDSATQNKPAIIKQCPIEDLRNELNYLRDFVAALVNSLGSEFKQSLDSINNRLDKVDPPVTNNELQPDKALSQFSTLSPSAPVNTDTPFIPIVSSPSRPAKPQCGIKLSNRFSDLYIPSQQTNQQSNEQQNHISIPVVPGKQSYSDAVNISSNEQHYQRQQQTNQQHVQHQQQLQRNQQSHQRNNQQQTNQQHVQYQQ